jgi:hypothetical protein
MYTKISLIICSTLILIGIIFWPTIYRFDSMTINGNIIPIKTNRLTGFTEHYVSGKWYSQNQKSRKGSTIPIAEREKITVKQEFSLKDFDSTDVDKNYFRAKIYNGSNWTITDITIRFKIEEGNILKLIGYGVIQPLSMGNISIERPKNFLEWEIDEIKGYQD